MTTASWSAVFAQTTAAEFRAWGLDLKTHLIAIGLVQSTDTGQIDWSTVAMPTTNNQSMGYEIWKFGDALQATAPIFIKIEYGSSGSASFPSIWITVGTGSNGSGTITNIGVARRQLTHQGTIGSAVTAYPNYLCHVAGFLGVVLRVGYANVNTLCSFIICRYSDDDGTPNGNGYVIHATANSQGTSTAVHPICQSVRTAAPATIFPSDWAAANGTGYYGLWPHGTSGFTTVEGSGDFQAIPFWYPTKKFQQAFGMCGVLSAELSMGNTKTFALKGATPRTFIGLGVGLGFGGQGANDGRHAMLWE